MHAQPAAPPPVIVQPIIEILPSAPPEMPVVYAPRIQVPSISKLRDFDDPEQVSMAGAPESNKKFEVPTESKKDFEARAPAPIIPTLIEAARIFIETGGYRGGEEQRSKKDFDSEPDSKKDFEPALAIEDDHAPEFDREGEVGRDRYDWQVAELVIYRFEYGKWPDDVPVDTGLRSYYELRYFDEGTNRRGVKYSELYAKHRAKRDLWLDQYKASGGVSEADLDTPTTESNVVHFPDRRANSAR